MYLPLVNVNYAHLWEQRSHCLHRNSSANVSAVKPGIKSEGDISVGENCHAPPLLRVNGLQNEASPQTSSSTTVRVQRADSHKPHYAFFASISHPLTLFSRVLLQKHLSIITELTQMEAITPLLKYFLEKGSVLTLQTVGCNHDLIEVHVKRRSARWRHSYKVG